MRIAIVAPGIPSPGIGGGGNWNTSLMRYFARRGHQVIQIAIVGKYRDSVTATQDELASYRELGVELVTVPWQEPNSSHRSKFEKLKAVFNASADGLWPLEAKTRVLTIEAIENIQPDCVLLVGFEAVLWTRGMAHTPRVGVQAEGPYINTYVNWRYNPAVTPGLSIKYLRYSLRAALLRILQERVYARLTSDLTIAAFQGPHYVAWAGRKGISNVVYVTTPVPDPVGSRWRELRASVPRPRKTKILMIGHLHSTSNRSSLPIFFHEILPRLEKEWGHENFEIHFVGDNSMMPRRFDRWREHPSLIFRGPVHPADQEFLTSDVLLVPVPAKTGSRVRIINGFSFGCCIVAHSANALGIPELRHEQNALLGNTGKAIADQVIRAASDPGLQGRLGENGRRVFEQNYSEDVGGEQYVKLLESAVSLAKLMKVKNDRGASNSDR